jgi:thioredoxin-related protein
MKQAFAWLLWIVTWALPVAALASPPGAVPVARDLQRDAQTAEGLQAAVLVAFVSDHCGYCERVLNEYLNPMYRMADYQNKVVMRLVKTRSPERLNDFAGKPTTQGQFAKRHGIQLVPTIALFDKEGRLLGKPLVGLSTIDYYGMYLDDTIDQAVARVRSSVPPASGS